MTLVRRDPRLAASLVAGLGYPLLWDRGLPAAATIVAKGLGVGLLALLAALRARTTDGWLLAAVMGCGALGDVLLDIRFELGVAAFAIGHMVAIALYRRNRDLAPGIRHRLLALGLLAVGAAAPCALLDRGDPRFAALLIYSLLLTAMAAAAWLSRFPRSRTGVGAILFVLSDTLIAARMGPLVDRAWVGHAVWLSYYAAQLLIFLGISSTLRGRAI